MPLVREITFENAEVWETSTRPHAMQFSPRFLIGNRRSRHTIYNFLPLGADGGGPAVSHPLQASRRQGQREDLHRSRRQGDYGSEEYGSTPHFWETSPKHTMMIPSVAESINCLVADGKRFAHPLHHLGKAEKVRCCDKRRPTSRNEDLPNLSKIGKRRLALQDLPVIAIDSFRHMYLFEGMGALGYGIYNERRMPIAN